MIEYKTLRLRYTIIVLFFTFDSPHWRNSDAGGPDTENTSSPNSLIKIKSKTRNNVLGRRCESTGSGYGVKTQGLNI